jgi:hypothetical protein
MAKTLPTELQRLPATSSEWSRYFHFTKNPVFDLATQKTWVFIDV